LTDEKNLVLLPLEGPKFHIT